MPYSDLPEDFQQSLAPLFQPDQIFSLAHRLANNQDLMEKILNLVTSDPRLPALLTDEAALLKFLKEEMHYEPTVNDRRIRHCFWLEYENSILGQRRMVLNNVHSLVLDSNSFYRLFVQHAGRAAFLLCKPTAYQEQLKEMLAHSSMRMRNILDLPDRDEKGKLDHRLLTLKAKIHAMVEMRLHGAPTQKIQQVNLNLNGEAQGRGSQQDVTQLVQKGDMPTIQARIREIEQQMRKDHAQNHPAPEPVVVVPKISHHTECGWARCPGDCWDRYTSKREVKSEPQS